MLDEGRLNKRFSRPPNSINVLISIQHGTLSANGTNIMLLPNCRWGTHQKISAFYFCINCVYMYMRQLFYTCIWVLDSKINVDSIYWFYNTYPGNNCSRFHFLHELYWILDVTDPNPNPNAKPGHWHYPRSDTHGPKKFNLYHPSSFFWTIKEGCFTQSSKIMSLQTPVTKDSDSEALDKPKLKINLSQSWS